MPKLSIVPPAPPPAVEKRRQRIQRAAKPPEVLQCRCGGRELIETKTGVEFVGGKTRGGTKALICAACWRKGERVVVA